MRMSLSVRALLLLGLAGVLFGCGGDRCAVDLVQARLDAALAGERVDIAGCRVVGSLRVPAQVTLEGARDTTQIVGRVELEPSASGAATTLRGVRIESVSGQALRVAGAGSFAIDQVDVDLATGIGLVIRDATAGSVRGVRIRGSVSAEVGATLAPGADPSLGAYGAIIHRSGTLAQRIELDDLEIEQAGPWGTIVDSSFVRWEGGGVDTITGVAAAVIDADVELVNLRVHGVTQGIQLLPAYGVALVDSAGVMDDVSVDEGEGVGVLVHASTLVGRSLVVRAQSLGGLIAQSAPSLEISGSMLSDNGLVGIGLVDVVDATIRDTDVTTTLLRRSIFGEATPIDVGDGMHILSPTGTITIERSSVVGNTRVGLIVDVGTAADLSRVRVLTLVADSSEGALGAVAQVGGSVAASGAWDASIERRGAALANDPSAVGTAVDTMGPLATSALPRPSAGTLVRE